MLGIVAVVSMGHEFFNKKGKVVTILLKKVVLFIKETVAFMK